MEDLVKNAIKDNNYRSGYMKAGDHKIYLKTSVDEEAFDLINGENESLLAINETNTVRVPKTYGIHKIPGGMALAMEYFDLKSFNRRAAELGTQLAKLHMNNIVKLEKSSHGENVGENSNAISKFGFHTKTCCGRIQQSNEWMDDWLMFFAQKIEFQVGLIENLYGDKSARELWSRLQNIMANYFKDLDVKASLLHGDLWAGNAAEVSDQPVIYDPSSFYGHHEFDLAISGMFGGFSRPFWSSYHEIFPKQKGFDERHQLYQLFHYLNHWSHFGSGYKSQSLKIMRNLCGK